MCGKCVSQCKSQSKLNLLDDGDAFNSLLRVFKLLVRPATLYAQSATVWADIVEKSVGTLERNYNLLNEALPTLTLGFPEANTPVAVARYSDARTAGLNRLAQLKGLGGQLLATLSLAKLLAADLKSGSSPRVASDAVSAMEDVKVLLSLNDADEDRDRPHSREENMAVFKPSKRERIEASRIVPMTIYWHAIVQSLLMVVGYIDRHWETSLFTPLPYSRRERARNYGVDEVTYKMHNLRSARSIGAVLEEYAYSIPPDV